MHLPVIVQVYALCAGFGAVVLTISACLGGLARGQAGAHGLGHGIGHLHGPAHGHTGAHLHGPAHGHSISARGHVSAPASGSGHSGAASGHHQPPAAAAARANSAPAAGGSENSAAVPLASAHHAFTATPEENTAAHILLLLNPTTISSFAVWFGISGIIAWRLLPFFNALITLPFALAGGALATKITINLIGMLASRLYASGSFSQQSLVGLQAEVTVPVNAGRTGEITCIAGGPRYSFSARGLNNNASFKRGELVIISDVRDDVAYVELWPDAFVIGSDASKVVEAPEERT